MIYEYNGKMKQIQLSDIDASHITVGLITLAELDKYNYIFGFLESTIAECQNKTSGFRGSIDDYEDYSFGILHIIDIGNIFGEQDRIGFYVKKNLFLLVDAEDRDDSTAAIFDYVMQQIKYPQITIEKLICAFFSRLVYKDSKLLEKMEFDIAELEERMDGNLNKRHFNSELLLMKKKLLLVRNYYEQLIDIGDDFRENDNDLFEEENLRYFKLITDKVTRLAVNINYMHETLVQLREAYEASIDINLNNTMKIFTVVTTIFLPLNLLVGWYGMNFNFMPELTWKYGYISVVLLSAAVVIICLWFFKKKKFL
ncbi:MAG: magnesium transporter CorA family protein [Eubacteriales bacterium]